MRSAPAAAPSRRAPLLLIDLETDEGVTGSLLSVVLFPGGDAGDRQHHARKSSTRRRANASRRVELWSKLAERFALIGVQGIVRMAMAGFDVAAWDALGQGCRPAAGQRSSAARPKRDAAPTIPAGWA